MHKIFDQRHLDFNIDFLYQVISDVELYPSFLPWCTNCKILSKDENAMLVESTMEHKGFKKKYTSSVKFIKLKDEYTIDITAIDGAFKFLRSSWNLRDVENSGTIVTFKIDFEFKSKILNKLMYLWLSSIKNKVTSAFYARLKARSMEIEKLRTFASTEPFEGNVSKI